ncbi:MAG: glycosyltransferase, partial [bacterium]
IVFSKNMKNQINSLISPIKRDCKVNHPGVDKKFSISQKNINKSSKFPADKKIILYVGRVVKEKNIELLIKSFYILDRNDSILLIVGDGEDRHQYNDLVKKLKIEDKVFFEGFKSNTEYYYNIATYLVLPTRYEAFGQVIIESIACGTPVIGFRSNPPYTKVATDEIIEHYKTGFLVDEYGEKNLSSMLNIAINYSYKNEYFKMRKNCIGAVKNDYNWQRFVENIIEMTNKN